MSKTSSVILGVLAGAAAGLVAGLLIAPESGSENRKKISNAAKKLADTLLHKAENAVDDLSSTVKKQ